MLSNASTLPAPLRQAMVSAEVGGRTGGGLTSASGKVIRNVRRAPSSRGTTSGARRSDDRTRLASVSLANQLQQQLYTSKNGRAEFWKSPDNCGHFYAENPRFIARPPIGPAA